MKNEKYLKPKVPSIKKPLIFFIITLMIYVPANLVLNCKINHLEIDIQKTEEKINYYKNENNKLKIEIGQLKNREKVIETANAYGLSINEDNIISLR